MNSLGVSFEVQIIVCRVNRKRKERKEEREREGVEIGMNRGEPEKEEGRKGRNQIPSENEAEGDAK